MDLVPGSIMLDITCPRSCIAEGGDALKKLYPTSTADEVITVVRHLPKAGGLIVGEQWLDVVTPGELARQVRRRRVEQVILGAAIYVPCAPSAAGKIRIWRTLRQLACIDAQHFADAERAYLRRNPQPRVGHTVPRRAKRTRMVAHGWGSRPVGCAQVRGLDQSLHTVREEKESSRSGGSLR